MRLSHWVRFTWDLEKLPALGLALPPHYHIGPAERADAKEIRAVITRSFAHDTSWGDTIHEVNALMDGWLERAFENSGMPIVLRHGLRIIGTAILQPDPAAENQLAPGPCVLMEYRNRGFGTALLSDALRRLREAGLTRVAARASNTAVAARFLYPKFNGVLMTDDKPLLAA